MRRFFPIAVVLAAFVVFAAKDALFPSLRVSPSDRPAATEPADDGAAPGQSARRDLQTGGFVFAKPTSDNIVHGTISRGQPFFLEMQRAGVSPIDIQEVVEATREIFNFKKVQPGQKYSVFSDSEGGLDSLKFVVDHEKILNVAKIGDEYQARVDMVPYRLERFVTSGEIDQSIFVTLQRIGAEPQLAVELTTIFQWDIDFFKDIRKGDTFSILYEKKIYDNGKTQMGPVLAARIVSQGRAHNAFRYQTADGNTNYYDEVGKSLQKSLLRAPLEYSRVSSNFSYHRKHPVTHAWAPHLGVDYAAPTGTPVRATGDGTVVVATREGASGNYVRIRHNSVYETYYLHLSRFGKGIRAGARVGQGQVIGYVGMTGMATGPHLDYRIKVHGTFVNPRTIELPSKEPVPAPEMASFEKTAVLYLAGLLDERAINETVAFGKPIYSKPPPPERMF
jgi:murein DD-endopeptidase MepM/ murein hydrolase activator NlpD